MPAALKININADDEIRSVVDDLRGLRSSVVAVLIAVITEELRCIPRADDPDEGRLLLEDAVKQWNWRRGIRLADRQAWDRGAPVPDAVRQAADHIIIYAYLSKTEARLHAFAVPTDYPGFYVSRIMHNSDLSPAVAAQIAAA